MRSIRQQLVTLLESGPHTALDLSGLVGASEKDVADHLVHVRRSIGKKFNILPAECLACGFVFKKRSRLTKPGRCPQCRSNRITPPAFEIDRS